MARVLKTVGANHKHARLLCADFNGLVRDGAIFQLKGQPSELRDGDMVMFNHADEVATGINVEEDEKGLCAHISFEPMVSFRVGLENLGEGAYAFRPASHHIELRPSLGPAGKGEKIG
jgi:hypothetical protein